MPLHCINNKKLNKKFLIRTENDMKLHNRKIVTYSKSEEVLETPVEIGISKEKIFGCIIITSSVSKYLQGTLVKQWSQSHFKIARKVYKNQM